jgi:hypothetical protein
MDNTLLAAIIGAIAGILGTYLGAILKFRKDLEAEYDKDLREKRIGEYKKLWELTQDFPKYARARPFGLQDAQKLMAALHGWYFQGGGLFLSDSSRPAYFDFKDALQELIKASKKDQPLDCEKDSRAHAKCHALRTALAGDVGTRKKLELE